MAVVVGTGRRDRIDTASASPGVEGGPATAGTDLIFGRGGDAVRAGGGDDGVFGADGRDTLGGQRGDDLPAGGGGEDTLRGGGGGGEDALRGGAGADRFLLSAGADLVAGLSPGRAFDVAARRKLIREVAGRPADGPRLRRRPRRGPAAQSQPRCLNQK